MQRTKNRDDSNKDLQIDIAIFEINRNNYFMEQIINEIDEKPVGSQERINLENRLEALQKTNREISANLLEYAESKKTNRIAVKRNKPLFEDAEKVEPLIVEPLSGEGTSVFLRKKSKKGEEYKPAFFSNSKSTPIRITAQTKEESSSDDEYVNKRSRLLCNIQ